MPLRLGCCGFPVGRARYFLRLGAVEVASTALRLPKEETVRRWREEAPTGFAFALRAPAAVCRFRRTAETDRVWRAFDEVRRALDAKLVVFESPNVFHASPAHFTDLYSFFRGLPREGCTYAWVPRGTGWEERTLEKVTSDLRLVRGVDPFSERAGGSKPRYYRVRGRRAAAGGQLSADEMRRLATLGRGSAGSSYLFLEHHDMWRDALKLQALLDGGRG